MVHLLREDRTATSLEYEPGRLASLDRVRHGSLVDEVRREVARDGGLSLRGVLHPEGLAQPAGLDRYGSAHEVYRLLGPRAAGRLEGLLDGAEARVELARPADLHLLAFSFSAFAAFSASLAFCFSRSAMAF